MASAGRLTPGPFLHAMENPKSRRILLSSFIDGKFLPSDFSSKHASNVYRVVPNIHAANGAVLCEVACANQLEVNAAVSSAVIAQREWRSRTPTERGRVLMETARLLRERNDEIAALETLDTSRVIAETKVVDVKSAIDALEYFGGTAALQQSGEVVTCGPGSKSFVYTRREPLGVTVGIGAFNYPLQSAAWKAAPALAFGNAMVFKPSGETPLSALALAQCFLEAGLPKGLFSVVLGDGETGQALVDHPDVAKVAFTGSVGTGSKVAQSAVKTFKSVTMELGGKSPMIVFPDADMKQALSGCMLANFYSNGEVCSNGTRVFVHRSIAKEFERKLKERVSKLRVGGPMDPTSDVSALISEAHLQKVLAYVQTGVEEGARLVVGGQRLTSPDALKRGAYMSPAILSDCKDEMRVVREEIFGPVACLLSFETEEEVIRRANDTPFGLAGGVFTANLERAHRVAHAIEAGQIWINQFNTAPVEVPWGGNKMSGMGRENGTEAVHAWTQVKNVHVELDGVVDPYPHTSAQEA